MNLVPTASTTAALALGDALAMTVLVEKGFRPDDFADLHPRGTLYRRAPARRSASCAAAPTCRSSAPGTPMREVIAEITRGRHGHHLRGRRRRPALRRGDRRRRPAGDCVHRRRPRAARPARGHGPDAGHRRARHARRRGAAPARAAQDHRGGGRRRRPPPGGVWCTCTNSGRPGWPEESRARRLSPLHLGAARPAGRRRHRQGLGALQAARRPVDRPPQGPRLASLRARPQLPGRQPDRPGHRGAEPGGPRRRRRARDPSHPRQRLPRARPGRRARSRCTRRCSSARSSPGSSTPT